MLLKLKNQFQKCGNILIFILAIVFFEVLPYLWNFPHIFTILHDNLENDVIRYKILANSGKMWASNEAIIPDMMCGLLRMCYNSSLYYLPWLYVIFSPYVAYVINLILIHVIGFLGVYLLSGKVLDFYYNHHLKFLIRVLLSLIYSYQLEYPNFGLSLSLLPWILLVIFDKEKMKWYYYIVVLIVPYFTLFTHFGLFLIFFLFLKIVFDKLIKRNWNKRLLFITIYLILGYLLVEYRLFLSFRGGNFISHRIEFNLHPIKSFPDYILRVLKLVSEGYYQAPFFGYGLLILLFLVLILRIKLNIESIFMLILFVCFGLFGVFYNTVYFKIISDKISFFRMFDLSRFYTIMPGFVLFLNLVTLNSIFHNNSKQLKIFSIFILVINFSYLIKHNHTFKDFIKETLPVTFKQEVNNLNNAYLDDFYSERLFQEIKTKLNYDTSYRVGSIGLHPGVLLFNGFYSIDGVISNYPLEYKKLFRKIIQKELDKKESIKRYFDEYGNRVYLFSSELNQTHYFSYQHPPDIKQLEFNNELLKKLKCKYIFSTSKIENIDKLNWRLVNMFSNKVYKIYVYEII